ncbi:MAG: undecaprenyl/decaprenyl-phosphate alpha-N-acetylglucosaminyl 1-phosphate transferase [Spirochaetia bacterium]|nr:undecaprenyl/decaprenyl-phosphate alpha-N-acetylglucosaminyl 1-phosphate transferase [Spirochaetia bacterium]
MEYFLIAISAFVLGLILVPLAMKTALKFDIIDHPNTELKKHKAPVPYLGGVAIYLAFLVPVIAAKLFMHQTFKGVYGILAGATIMMIMGLIDDKKNLKPVPKLIVQLAVALILVRVNMNIKFMDSNILNIFLTVLWVVGVTNSMNLIDIMDGLAGGVAAVASLAFFIVAYLAGRINDMIPAIALFGSVCAFLVYNRPPAKIYMGDAGSLFLGFMMASLALNESYSRNNYVAVLAPVLILAVPIFDTIMVSVIRVMKGMLPIHGSNDHLAQRLVMIGLTKPMAVLFMTALTFVLSVAAIISTFMNTMSALILYLFIAMAGFMFAVLVMSVDMTNYHKVHKKRSN